MQAQKQPTVEETLDLRRGKRERFLQTQKLEQVTLVPLQADASFRRYYRLQGASRPMLLMEDPPDRPPVPPFVMVEPFMKIAAYLRGIGLHAPEIYAADIPNGLLLIEDFGDGTYTRLFEGGHNPRPLYELAVDVLAHLHHQAKPDGLGLPAYDDANLVDEAMLLLDWYYPALDGSRASDDMKKSFAAVWRDLFRAFPQGQQALVLRDYHIDNLMLVSGATGLQSCGLLDFQDAVTGPFSYDLMSLLEDARRDVPEDLRRHLYSRYLQSMGNGLDHDGFGYSFRVLAAQRHAKVLGIFVRLSVRDGKDRYLKFIPHVHRLFMSSLANPALAPLQKWFAEQRIDIGKPLKHG
jgi:N-acetylmuramate 1-kinase